ncbi:MAG: hypothetical protein R3344_04885 [Acidobacteriota bacterium]|nr:hypothetical protein [Acidobacteriota bacterium]
MTLSRTTRLMRGSALAVTALFAAIVATPSFADEPLPEAEVILDKFVNACGGKTAFDKLENRVVKGSFTIPAMGLSAPLIAYSARPNKSYTLIESDAFGKIEQGTDGEVVWEISTMSGPVVKEGEERAELLKIATFDRVIYWRDNFKSVETVGIDEVDGQRCYRVKQTPKVGNDEFFCYDAVTYLPIRIQMTLTSEMGDIPMVMIPSDYRKVDGVLIAHKAAVQAMQVERVMVTESIEHNVDLAADRFAPPAQIASLLAETE